MDRLLNKLERKIGKYAIRNLSRYLIGAYAIGYVLFYIGAFSGNSILSYLTLEPYFIIHNFQIWRIISWVLVPTVSTGFFGIFFAIIMMILYYQLGSVLERTWGTFRFNVYIFGGILLTVIGAFVLHGIHTAIYGPGYIMITGPIGGMFSTRYINQSIFLAFAICYPNMEVLLYFILPIKMKWMAIFYAVLIFIDVIRSTWAGKIAIIASILNFVIFLLTNRQVRDNLRRVSPKEMKRKQDYKRATEGGTRRNPYAGQMPRQPMRGASSGVAKHRCAVCGRTDLDDPKLEFRFCSKCEGNYEYCQDHLFTHQHVRRS